MENSYLIDYINGLASCPVWMSLISGNSIAGRAKPLMGGRGHRLTVISAHKQELNN